MKKDTLKWNHFKAITNQADEALEKSSAFPDSFFFQSQSQRMTLPPESTRVKIVTGVHFLPETHQKL